MDRKILHTEVYSCYPGMYVPLPETENLLKERVNEMIQPPVNMDEFGHLFRVEVSLPGVQKQDIIIYVGENTITINVVHKDREDAPTESRIHEFDINYFERRILVPENADAELAMAEYKDGILYLYIPKVKAPVKLHPGKIVVY